MNRHLVGYLRQVLPGITGLIFAGMLLSNAAQATEATDQLRETVNTIITTLKLDNMDWAAKRAKIRTIVTERFFFRAMAQRTLAQNWRKANKDQQQRFTDLFSELLEHTYLDRIKEYTDEKVEFLREKQKDNKAVVYTQIITASNNIPIDYRLVKIKDKWLIYDVIIEEISLISNYRSSYREIVSRDGIDGLLEQMQQKVQELAASKPS